MQSVQLMFSFSTPGTHWYLGKNFENAQKFSPEQLYIIIKNNTILIKTIDHGNSTVYEFCFTNLSRKQIIDQIIADFKIAYQNQVFSSQGASALVRKTISQAAESWKNK